ncbi:DnaA N-terminal domain-containing protein [Bacillus cereus]|uniref:DnaA N-terminal domain-containing protein n=1 Tax=Bacillus cereus TaxID=1396 RepID=UPI00159BD45C|nr:DnaA N-terminal domain-containing protein [Bacillus cereus]
MNPVKWEKVKETLKQKISRPSYETWVKNLQYSQDNDVLILISPNNFHRDWVESHYKSLIFDVVREVNGESLEIEVVSEEKTKWILENDTVKEEDGPKTTLIEHLLKRISELEVKVEALEKNNAKPANNQIIDEE